MDLKFYLNKFAKIDNIEGYTMKSILILQKKYEEFLENSDGSDPDFPMMSFGGGKGKKVKGSNSASEEQIEDKSSEDSIDPLVG